MCRLKFNIDWQARDKVDPFLDQTTANFRIMLDNVCLTQNIDARSNATNDEVLVSLFPLAMWIASSWWRLQYEVLPAHFDAKPPPDWRLSHEMTAANFGFVWPLLVFSTDRRVMNVWAGKFPPDADHAVRYLNSLDSTVSISMSSFTVICRDLIEQVLERLALGKCADSDLAQLWSLILADLDDPSERRNRRIEAQFGFDPQECEKEILADMVALENERGEDVLAELAAVRTWNGDNSAHSIRELFEAPGIEAKPELPDFSARLKAVEPWEQAKADAGALRRGIDVGDSAVANPALAELLGVSVQTLEDQPASDRLPVAIAGRTDDHCVRFVPRKRHPLAQRFEWARLLGGYADTILRDGDCWLASTDATTARQKYQRAFAAEFLCPIEHLTSFLDGDFSESRVEDAADMFSVSELTVRSQLKNNHVLPRQDADFGPPYSMVA